MAVKPKFFRVAKEGKTIDGREITRDQIVQMAATYDPKLKHGARVNIEHIRSFSPNGEFQCVGDVLSLKTEEDADKKLVLLAEVDPTPEMVQLSKDRKKVYFSIEMYPDYQGTGIAYMGGLALTDDPASAGTEMAKFSKSSGNADSLISAGVEDTLEFADDDTASDKPDEAKSLFARVSAMLTGTAKNAARFAENEQAITAIAAAVGKVNDELATTAKTADVATLTAQVDKLSTDLAALTSQLSETPADAPRDPITGGTGDEMVDC
jgi:hypothetical protein